jgi:hypothetical protein
VGHKKNILILLLFLFFCPFLYSQKEQTDSLNSNRDLSISDSSYERQVNIPIESLKFFVDPYQLRNYDLQFSTDFNFSKTLGGGSFNQDMLYIANQNKQDFLLQISRNFQQSKPTTWQKILGMVNTGAVAAMAGYHVYKYYVKEKKKF